MQKWLLIPVLLAVVSIQITASSSSFVVNENFDAGAPSGWTVEAADQNNKWVHTTEAGNGFFLFNNPGNETIGFESRVVTNVFDINQYMDPVIIFSYQLPKWNGDIDELSVYFKASPTDSWQKLNHQFADYTTTWRMDTIRLPRKSENYQIAFGGVDRLGNGIMIDNVIVRECPSCEVPNGVQATNIDKTSAFLLWGDNGLDATSYRVRVDSKSLSENILNDPDYKTDIIDTIMDISSGRYLQLTGLTMGADHHVYIQTNCSGEKTNHSAEYVFTTMNNITLPYLDGFNVGSTGIISRDVTWYYGNNKDKDGPYISSQLPEANLKNYSLDKTQTLSFADPLSWGAKDLEANEKCYAATPEILVSAGKTIADCEVLFSVKAGTTQTEAIVKVGVMTNPKKIDSFELVKEIAVTKSDMFKDVTIALTGANVAAKYVAIMSDRESNNQFHIDNFQIREVPACPRARDLDILAIEPTSIALDWNRMGGTTGEVMLTSEAITDFSKDYSSKVVSTVTATAAAVSFTGLTEWTVYYVYARNTSGATNGEWSAPVMVRTPQSMPADGQYFTFTADAATDYAINPGSTYDKMSKGVLALTDGEVYPKLSTPYMYNTPYKTLEWNSITEGRYSAAIFPKMDNPQLMRVVMNATAYDLPSRIQLGMIEVVNDIETFTALETIELEKSMKRYVLDLSEYTGTAKYFAIKYIGLKNPRIDDVEFKLIPTCGDPQNVDVLTATDNATISWDASGATSWRVRVSKTDVYTNLTDPTYTGGWIFDQQVSTPTVNIPGLESNGVRYFFYIMPICGDGSTGEWTNSREFQTQCAAISSFPHLEDLKYGYSAGTYKILPCHKLFGSAGYNTFTNYNGETSKLQIISTAASTDVAMVVFPTVSPDIQTLQFNVNIANRNDVGFVEYGVVTDPDDVSTFVKVGEIRLQREYSAYDYHELFFSHYAGTGKNIAIRAAAGEEVNYEISSYTIDAKDPCPAVKDLSVSDTTGVSATLHWLGDLETEWDVVVATRALSILELDAAVTTQEDFIAHYSLATTNSFALTDLDYNTFYFWYVRAKCPASVNSAWSEAGTFRTFCGVLTPEEMGVEDFENYNPGQKPACWTCDNTEESVFSGTQTHTDPSISSSIKKSGLNSLQIATVSHNATSFDNTMYVVSPEIDTDDISTLQVSFWGYGKRGGTENMQGQLNVGIVTDLNDLSTFVLVETIDNFQQGYQYTIPFDTYTGDLNGQKGKYVMFTTPFPKDNEFYLDDVAFSAIPSCAAPAHINITDILCEGAEVTWSATSTVDFIKIAKAKQLTEEQLDSDETIEDVQIITDITGNTHTFTGLERRTEYYVYLGTICGGDTIWGNIRGFETACEDIYNLPYLTTFDEKDRTGNYAHPDCWTAFYGEERIWYQKNTIATGGYEGKALEMYVGSALYTSYAVMPKLATDVNETLISFYAEKSSTLQQANIVVGVVTDMTSRETIKYTFTPIDTILITEDGYKKYYAPLGNYNGKEGNIAFSMLYRYNISTAGAMSSGSVMLDNVVADSLPTCMFPDELKVTAVAPDSINISFVEIAGGTSWDVACVAAGADIDLNALYTASATNYSIKGLTANTMYDIYVRTACSSTNQSPWIGPITQGTATAAITAFPVNETFDAAGTWQLLADASSNAWAINTNAVAGDGALFVSNDGGTSATYSPSEESALTAFQTLYLTPGVYNFAYDLDKLAGEVSNLHVGLVSTKAMLIAGTDSVEYADGTKATIESVMLEFSGNTTAGNTTTGYITIDNEMGGYYYYVISWTNDAQVGATDKLSFAIDNIDILKSSCVQPLDVKVGRKTSTEADLTWELVGAQSEYSQWKVMILTEATNEPDTVPRSAAVTCVITTIPSAIVTGLSELTTYYAYVRATCSSDNSNTTWSEGVSFKTPCAPVAVGTVFDFDASSEIGTTSCIQKGTLNPKSTKNGFNVKTNTSTSIYSRSGGGALYLKSQKGSTYTSPEGSFLSLPHIEGSLDNVQLTFYMRPFYHRQGSSNTIGINEINGSKLDKASNRITIAAMTDLADTATYTKITDCIYPYDDTDVNTTTTPDEDPMGQNYWVKYSVPLKGFDGQYIMFYDENTTSALYTNLYIDSIAVEYMPTCPMPREVTISNITDETVDVSFKHTDGVAWEYRYSTDPRMSGAVTGTTNSANFTISGLDQATTYYVNVRQVCSASDKSEWTSNQKVRTSYAVRYEEKFTAVQITPNEWKRSSSTNVEEHFETGKAIQEASITEATGWNYAEISDYASSHQYTMVSASGTTGYWLITPKIYLQDAQSAYISFDAAVTLEGNYDPLPESITKSGNVLMLLVSLDGGNTWKREDATTWDTGSGTDEVSNFYALTNKFQSVRVNLDKYAGNNVNIAFYTECGGPVNIDFHLDNVYINSFAQTNIVDEVCETNDYVHTATGITIPSSKLDVNNPEENHFEIYQLSTDGGSDDLYVFDITVNPLTIETIDAEICGNESYNSNGFSGITAAGEYKRKISRGDNCDSIAVLNLTVNALPANEFTAYFCAGSTYTWNGKEYTEAGRYTDTVPAIEGCDSSITMNLVSVPSIEASRTYNLCQGESVEINGQTFTSDGSGSVKTIVESKTASGDGCDSIITHTITYAASYNYIIEAAVCYGEMYDDNGFSVAAEDSYTLDKTSSLGCDSTVTLNLIVIDNEESRNVTREISTKQLPYDFYGVVFDENTEEKTYTGTVTVTAESGNCSMDVNYTIIIGNSVGVDNVNAPKSCTITPNPSAIGETVTVDGNFTDAQMNGMVVEVYSAAGTMVQRFMPQDRPITISALNEAGMYIVRLIDGNGTIHMSKVIVK